MTAYTCPTCGGLGCIAAELYHAEHVRMIDYKGRILLPMGTASAASCFSAEVEGLRLRFRPDPLGRFVSSNGRHGGYRITIPAEWRHWLGLLPRTEAALAWDGADLLVWSVKGDRR